MRILLQLQKLLGGELIRALKISEVAEILGIPERTAYHLVKVNPSLEAIKVGRHLRVMSDSLEAWIQSKKTP
jgi:excisionase family DNA binding protein